MTHNEIFVGNFTGQPALLKDYLKGFDYLMTYTGERCLVFAVIHPHAQGDPITLFELQLVPYETAEKFAKLFGLVPRHIGQEIPYQWKSKIPTILLWHDESEDADRIVLELVKLDLPYFIIARNATLRVQFGQIPEDAIECKLRSDSIAPMIEAIRTFAREHGKLPEKKKVA